MRRRDLRSDTHRDGIEACRRFWLGSHVAQRSGRVALRVSDVRGSPPIKTVERKTRDFGRSQHSLFGRKLHPHTVFFPASHLQPYERSTEGGLFGSIGFYHLTARQSSTVIEVRFVDFRRLGSFRTSISEFLSRRSWKFCDLLQRILHKYKTDIHTKDATRSVWKCDQFSPTPTRFAAKGPRDR